MEFIFDVRNGTTGGGGGGGVTNIGTANGITGGPITTTGVISLSQINTGALLSNITGFTDYPTPSNLTDIFDYVFDSTQGDLLYRNGTVWTFLPPGISGEVLTTGGPASNPSWQVAPGGSFNPAATLYFGIGGNDLNPGTQLDPFLTLGQAVTTAQALIVGGAPFISIIGLGKGVDTSNVNITLSGIDIYAPGIQHNPVTGDALTVNITTGGASYINVVLASSTVASGAKVLNLLSTVAGHPNVTRFYYVGATFGDVYLNVMAEFNTTIIAGLLTANQSGTNVFTEYGIGSQTQQTRLNLEGMLFGAGGGTIHGPMNCSNAWRYPMRQIRQLTSNITLAYTDSGYLYINSTTNPYTVTLPDTTGQGTPPFVIGYENTFLNLSTGSISFAAAGAATLVGSTTISAIGQRVNCTLTAANLWEVDETGGSVSLINTSTGLTGGPISSVGTISFASVANHSLLANISGISAPPTPHILSDILDSVFTSTRGSLLYRAAAQWSYLIPNTAGYVLTTGGPSADPSWQPGGGSVGNHAYQKAVWVAQNGNNSFLGTSINDPLLILQNAVNALPSGGVINIVDGGSYAGTLSIPSGRDITINAPGAFINLTNVTLAGGGSIFKVNAYSFGTNFNNIISSANCTIYIQAEKLRGNFGNGVTNPNQLFIKAQEISGDYTFTTGASVIMEFDSLAGDIIDTSGFSTAASIIINGRTQTGNITSTNSNAAGFLGFSSGSPIITGIRQGYFNGTYYGNQRNTGTWFNVGPVNGQPYNVVTWSTAQTNVLNGTNFETYSNAYINYTGNNGYGRFDLTNDAAVPVGFKCWMFQNVNDNQTGVLSSGIGGVANIVSPSTVPGVAYTRRNGSWILLTKVAQSGGVATFNVSGDLWQSNLSSSTVNFCISQTDGDDALADGSYNNQFATINACKTYVITNYTANPSHGINLIITDDAIYNDTT